LIGECESDAALLERFARGRDEAAFEALVERHGPAVRRACRRVLASEQDVDDVFQATFLVLAHKAGSVRWDGSIVAWLHAVARRLALHLRARAGSRKTRELPLGTVLDGPHHPCLDPRMEIERRELRRLVREALGRLPEKYRAPVVLCYLEGKTNEEAARQLGWPAGSMSRRLERARSLLRRRLAGSALLGALALVAATLAMSRGGQVEQGAVPREGVKQAMRSLRSFDAQADREQLAGFARTSDRVARMLAGHHPGEQRLAWLFESARMRQAAGELAAAAEGGDRLALLTAARRLDATCVRCHEIFRP
jgi:RNA polymerase sigma-70 factor (ECF subfamily)